MLQIAAKLPHNPPAQRRKPLRPAKHKTREEQNLQIRAAGCRLPHRQPRLADEPQRRHTAVLVAQHGQVPDQLQARPRGQHVVPEVKYLAQDRHGFGVVVGQRDRVERPGLRPLALAEAGTQHGGEDGRRGGQDLGGDEEAARAVLLRVLAQNEGEVAGPVDFNGGRHGGQWGGRGRGGI